MRLPVCICIVVTKNHLRNSKINCQIQKDKLTFQNSPYLKSIEVPDPIVVRHCRKKIGLSESATLFEDRVFQHEFRSQTV